MRLREHARRDAGRSSLSVLACDMKRMPNSMRRAPSPVGWPFRPCRLCHHHTRPRPLQAKPTDLRFKPANGPRRAGFDHLCSAPSSGGRCDDRQRHAIAMRKLTLGLCAYTAMSILWPPSTSAETVTTSTANSESQPSLHLDLKGGSLLWLTDGTILRNGKPISCAELKAESPHLFLKSGGNPPQLTGECLTSSKTGIH